MEIVRRGYDAFDRRDLEALGDDIVLTPSWTSQHPIPDFPIYRGGQNHLFRFFATYLSGFSSTR